MIKFVLQDHSGCFVKFPIRKSRGYFWNPREKQCCLDKGEYNEKHFEDRANRIG